MGLIHRIFDRAVRAQQLIHSLFGYQKDGLFSRINYRNCAKNQLSGLRLLHAIFIDVIAESLP
jgi:hypothetical protein